MKKFIPILLLFLAACKPEMPEVPKDIIPPDKMIKILEEVHIADAVSETKAQAGGNEFELTRQYYPLIYKKYGVTEEDFRKSYAYYEANPVWMNKMYDTILNDLSKKEEEVGKEKKAN